MNGRAMGNVAHGYMQGNLADGKGRTRKFYVHRLQAFQLFGEAALDADCVRHLDGNKLNNRPENLAIGTYKDNMADHCSDGLRQVDKARMTRGVYVSPDTMRAWARLVAGGMTMKEAAAKVGVNYNTAKCWPRTRTFREATSVSA